MRDENTERPSQNIKRKDSDTMNILEKATRIVGGEILEGEELKSEALKVMNSFTTYLIASKKDDFDQKLVEYSYDFECVDKKKRKLRKVSYNMKANKDSGIESYETHFMYDITTEFGKATDRILSNIALVFSLSAEMIDIFSLIIHVSVRSWQVPILFGKDSIDKETDRDEYYEGFHQMVESYKSTSPIDTSNDTTSLENGDSRDINITTF